MKCGIKGAIHVVADLFEGNHTLPTGWGVMLVDTSNAFNSLNCATILRSVRILWPFHFCILWLGTFDCQRFRGAII